MSMNVGSEGGDEEDVVSSINTTPLVDVMLVLLIIFLITIPVVTHTVPVKLPEDANVPTQTKPENINIAVNKDGDVFWNEKLVPNNKTLLKMLETAAQIKPQPEVHIRGDQDARYEYIGRVVYDAQRASIFRIGFITQPPPRGGRPGPAPARCRNADGGCAPPDCVHLISCRSGFVRFGFV